MKIKIGKYPRNGKQRKSIHIDPWDTWNMDHTLADIILPMLRQLRKTQHGAPCTDDEDVPENLRSTAAKPKKNEWDTDSNHFKRWDWIMKEMIWTFNEHAKDRDPNFYIKKPKYKRVKKEGSEFDELVVVSPGEFDYAKSKAYWERKKNGFRLFGKYYQNLWD
jgi:hypothetical protein